MNKTLPHWLQLLAAIVLTLSVTALLRAEEDYDRLDGKGASGKRVDVIEWEGNLEVHVYPKGSLVGLALKLDQRQKDKTVMVIAYRFNNAPKKPLIRRAIIGIPFAEKFQAYHASKEPDFDKIIISNNGLSADLAAYKLDPEPTQLYPDDPVKKSATKEATPAPIVDPVTGKRLPSGEDAREPAAQSEDREGTIKPFQW